MFLIIFNTSLNPKSNHQAAAEMKLNHRLVLIIVLASFILRRVAADSEVAVPDTIIPVLSKPINGSASEDNNSTIDSGNKGVTDLGEDKSAKRSELGGVGDEESEKEKKEKKAVKEAEEGRLPLVRKVCDSSSISCTDDDKTLVACLRVPGNESPDLSLWVQNKGKGMLGIMISAPDLVQLEKNQIELQGNNDAEVKISIKGIESGHFITLTAGHGNCSLDFRNQFLPRKELDHSNKSSQSSTFKSTFSMGFLFLSALLIVIASLFIITKLARSYFARSGPRYQKLDAELPVYNGSNLKPGDSDGWDDGWGDDWDDEEAPKTPTYPVTPSLSSKGMASRKIGKDSRKD